MAGAGEFAQALIGIVADLVRCLSDSWQARRTQPEPRDPEPGSAPSDSARARSSAPPAAPRSRPR